jgi:hypothetical protein
MSFVSSGPNVFRYAADALTDHSVSQDYIHSSLTRCQSLSTDITKKLVELEGMASKAIASSTTVVKMLPDFRPWSTVIQRGLQNVRDMTSQSLMPVYEMLRFAQDLKTCRKIAFARVGPNVDTQAYPSVLLNKRTALD